MRILGILLLMALPVQALALSCVRPSVARTFEEVHAAKETYIVVTGRLTLETRKLPKSHSNNPKPPDVTRMSAKLTGQSMTREGFNVPFEKMITLEVLCFGPWCGGARNGEEVLAFLRRDAKGYALEISPCGGKVFSNPKPATLKEVQQCFASGACAD